jgi:arylsulfatase A-like enzyme
MVAAFAACVAMASTWGCNGAGEGPESTASSVWDLLSLVRAEPAGPPGRTVGTLEAYGETRMAVSSPLPATFAYPVTVPRGAVLDFGYALDATVFLSSVPQYSQPTRFRVVLTARDGAAHVLLDRVVDIRDRAEDRRWTDVRVDLAPYAGVDGTLAFTATLEEPPPDYDSPARALFSAPRVVTPAGRGDVNLLLVTVDCLRADHVGAYGYARPTTPALDALASEGVRFAHAYADAPMTIPSLPQILTSSLFPAPRSALLTGPVAAAGIPSAAVVNNVWLSIWLGSRPPALPDGFDLMLSGDDRSHAGVLTDRAIAWLDRHRGDRFVLYVHYLDAHSPYTLYPDAADVFGDPAYHGPVTRAFDDQAPDSAARYDAADRARVVSLYDGGVRFIDQHLGRLIRHLRDDGRLDRTIVVVSADHGEEFWEHGRFFHGQSLYDELLHVPLVVRLPGAARAGTVVDRPVRTIDIAPTLLDWAGLAPPPGFAGHSLRAALEHPDDLPDDVVSTATNPQFPMRYGIRTATAKLVETVRDATRELYDLAHDAGEHTNRVAAEPDAVGALASRLAAARAPLATRGYQLRVVGPTTPARFRLRLDVATDAGLFVTLDRTAGPPDTTVDTADEGHALVVEGQADAAGRAFRFDRMLGFGTPNVARVTLTVDGAPAPPAAVELGAAGTAAGDAPLDLDAPVLEATAPPNRPPPDHGVRVALWRMPGAMGGTTKGPDPAARERLRALGYVQ